MEPRHVLPIAFLFLASACGGQTSSDADPSPALAPSPSPSEPASVPASTPAPVETIRGTHRHGPWTVTWTDQRVETSGPQGAGVVIVDDPSLRVLSAVGKWISYSTTTDGVTTWTATDVEDPGSRVDLRDVFSEADIFAALRSDMELRKALRGKTPGSLGPFLTALEGGCSMKLGEEMLTQFAFHGLRGDRVSVHVGVAHGCDIEKGAFTEFEFDFPIGELMPVLVPAAASGTLLEER